MTFMASRRYLAVIVSIIMVISLCACNETANASEQDSEKTVKNETEEDITAQSETDLSDTTSLEFARLMGYGINLGNTMEACDSKERVPNRETEIYETMWGQPVTTQEMVTGMKNAGFKTLRIPVAWTNAMDFENGDYTINNNYLERVEEIINYALAEDMFVVINDHWDHSWWSMFSHAEQSVRNEAMEIFTAMWSQISEKYEKYDERLIFEAANEELGNRFNDKTPFNPDGGNLTQDECYELLTVVNQKFVDTIRAAGGNNANRFLLIPGYNTDIVMTCDERYKMPVDTAPNKLLLSVHYYTPWSYCGDTSGVGHWGTTSEVEEQNELLAQMSKFTEQGYGIVIGEWGVLDNKGSDRYDYFFNFLNNCDKYGYSPLLWDTGGLYDRTKNALSDDEDDAIEKIASLFKERSAKLTVEEIIIAAEDNIAWQLKKAANKPEVVISAEEAFAWLMFSSGDWSLQYSVGDSYKPDNISDGAAATDAEITGAGTYTVALDFTGTDTGHASGISFSALGIINGEILFPGYIIEITEVLINGEPAEFSGTPYTTSDNKVCTRVNLYNEWVSQIPEEARSADGDLSGASPVLLENYSSAVIETISITFEYIGG